MAADSGRDDTLTANHGLPAPDPEPSPDTPPTRVAGAADTAGLDSAGDPADLIEVDPGHYLHRKLMTQGGMGRISSAWDRRLRRTVALKELRLRGADLRFRFEREAFLTARLQHPSIVSVHEAGRWPSGEPFYAMKLVAGRPLHHVVAQARSLEERLALLPHVLAVADALAYAHQQRIIHRDLKPSNVLCGDFGETVVIDWGLATALGDARSASGPDDVPGAGRALPMVSDGALTEVGTVLGTPAYMAPEQAEGEPVDERADVYALGGLLYHVLAGGSPYAERGTTRVLEAVRRGPPQPLAERQAGVPPDLLAVVDRAMARAPADRYPTARELADDLRRFQSGQLVGAHRYSTAQLVRRWLRRHRGAVAVAAVAAALLVAVGVVSLRRVFAERRAAEAERAAAERHRAEAESHRAETEELMDFMLGDLRDKLRPIGKLDLLDAVARKARDHYQARPADTPDQQRRRASALVALGEVLRAQGDGPAALAAFEESLTIRAALSAAAPEVAERRRDLSISHDRIGDVLLEQGNTAGALAAYRKAMTLREALTAGDPGHAVWRSELALSHSKIGTVLSAQGDAPGALAAFREAAAARAQLAASDPGKASWQRDLAVSHESIGEVLRTQGDAAGAMAAYRASMAIRERLVAGEPDNAIWQVNLSNGHEKIGDMLADQGDAKAAMIEYRKTLAIRQKLVADDPAHAGYRRDLSVAHNKIGDVLVAGKDWRGGLAAYQAGLDLRMELAASDPKHAGWQRDVAVSQVNVGDMRLALGDAGQALADYRLGTAKFEELSAADPSNARLRRDVVIAMGCVGDAQVALGDRAAALATYGRALELAEKLAASDSTNARWRRDVAELRGKVDTCCRRPPRR